MITYHEAKNELDRAILAGEFELPDMPEPRRAATLAIFRFLLSHAFYIEDNYGYVREDRTSIERIVELTGYSVSTVKRALAALHEARYIHRQKRPIWNGGRESDLIAITWAVIHAEDDSEGVSLTLSEEDADGAEGVSLTSEGVSLTPSFLSKKTKKSDDQRANHSGKDRAKEDCPVEDMDRDVNEVLAGWGVNLPVPFSFTRLGRTDRTRVPDLLADLDEDFCMEELLCGLVLEGNHNLSAVEDGARWLAHVLRGVSEAELRAWVVRGKKHYDDLEDAQEAAEPAKTDRDIALDLIKELATLTGQAPGDIEHDLRAKGMSVKEVIRALKLMILDHKVRAN